MKLIKSVPKCGYYLKAFYQILEEKDARDIQALKQLIFYGVKYVATHRYENEKYTTYEDVQNYFNIIETIRLFMARLTPNQFMNIFPIRKDFHGEKFMSKDYFTTVETLKQFDMDKPIGGKIDDLLWDYQNTDLGYFIVEMFSAASDLRKMQTGKGIMEEFLEDKGIPSYNYNKKKGTLTNNLTGETIKCKRKTPKYLQVVK